MNLTSGEVLGFSHTIFTKMSEENIYTYSDTLDDYIFNGNILLGIRYIKDKKRLNLSDSIKEFSERYEDLVVERPSKFKVSIDNYWDGFYS